MQIPFGRLRDLTMDHNKLLSTWIKFPLHV